MQLDIWLTMLVASILISVSPGAGAVVSMNYGLKYGLKRSYAAIMGLQMGLFVQNFCGRHRTWFTDYELTFAV